MRNHLPPLFVLLAVMTASLAGCGRGRAPDGSGTIECTQVTVSAKVAGRIESLPAEEGAAVAAGDTLALLDAAEYELQRDGAAAAVARRRRNST